MARVSRTDPQLPALRTSSGVPPTEAEPAERLASSEFQQAPGAWTPDGKTLLFMQVRVRQPDTTSGRSRSRAIGGHIPFCRRLSMNSTRISPRMDVGSRTYRTSLDALKCTFSPTPDLARGSRSQWTEGPRQRGRAMDESFSI